MSKVAIVGNPSGTGVFTIQSPNTSTDRTLTLPDSTGTVDTLQRAGNVLQVVSANGSYVSWSSAGLVTLIGSTSITVQANSKILVTTTIPHYAGANGTWGSALYTYIFENGSNVQQSEHVGTVTNEAQAHQINLQYLSGTKTAGTYSYIIYGQLTSGSGTQEVGRANRIPNIIIMEIAA